MKMLRLFGAVFPAAFFLDAAFYATDVLMSLYLLVFLFIIDILTTNARASRMTGALWLHKSFTTSSILEYTVYNRDHNIKR